MLVSKVKRIILLSVLQAMLASATLMEDLSSECNVLHLGVVRTMVYGQGTCLLTLATPKTWAQAIDYCNAFPQFPHGRVWRPNNMDTMNELDGAAIFESSASYWIGLQQAPGEMSKHTGWLLVDTKTGDTQDGQFLVEQLGTSFNDPNGNEQNMLYSGGSVRDRAASASHQVACEFYVTCADEPCSHPRYCQQTNTGAAKCNEPLQLIGRVILAKKFRLRATGQRGEFETGGTGNSTLGQHPASHILQCG